MNAFDCIRTTRWLDEGGDGADAALVDAHAASCPTCLARVEADRAVVAFLSASALPVTPSPDFAARVMARVRATAQDVSAESPATARSVAAYELPIGGDAFPWWVRAATQPACALALVLAALAIVYGPQIARAAWSAPQWSTAVLAVVTGALAPWLVRVGSDPVAATGVALAVATLVLLLSSALFRLGASFATVHFAPPLPRGRSLPGA